MDATVRRIETAGGKVARSSELLPDLAAAHQIYLTLLTAAMSRGAPPSPDLISAHGWMDALDAQLAFRRLWRALFEAFDVVLAPVLGVVAFEHMTGDWRERTFVIDGAVTRFADQLVWPGMATLANLPATAVPIGANRQGLPIGMQVIGPYLEDRTPIAFAGLLAGL
jgi:amidase